MLSIINMTDANIKAFIPVTVIVHEFTIGIHGNISKIGPLQSFEQTAEGLLSAF